MSLDDGNYVAEKPVDFPWSKYPSFRTAEQRRRLVGIVMLAVAVAAAAGGGRFALDRALLADLASRGMLESTLVIWGGEFGRTSDSQGAKGRDHNPNGFTIWMAGAGVKGGHHHGATDPFGYKAVEDKVHVNDLHATLLHLMGIDHLKLTHRFNGRDFRLTDVGGEVLRGILA